MNRYALLTRKLLEATPINRVLSFFALFIVMALPVSAALGDDCSDANAPCFDKIDTPTASLSKTLQLEIKNLSASQRPKVLLYLNDLPFAPPAQAGPGNVVIFDLSALPSDPSKNWSNLWDGQNFLKLGGTLPITIKLQTPDGIDIAKPQQLSPTFNLVVFSAPVLWIGLAIAATLAIILLRVEGALRDPPVVPPYIEPVTKKPGLATFSLGKCQMAFWFVLNLSVFIVLWAITGSYDDIITTQSLTLMGISGTAGVAGAMINSTQGGGSKATGNFFKDILQYPTEIPAIPAVPGTKGVPGTPAVPAVPGVWSFYRLQIFVWTIILGIISLISVCTSMQLPNFDPQLLTLMGISSGLYLGFKFPEQ